MYFESFIELLKKELLGVLPEEDDVFLSCGFSLPKSSDSYKAYKMLSINVNSGSGKIFDVTKKYKGFFGIIRRSVKRGI